MTRLQRRLVSTVLSYLVYCWMDTEKARRPISDGPQFKVWFDVTHRQPYLVPLAQTFQKGFRWWRWISQISPDLSISSRLSNWDHRFERDPKGREIQVVEWETTLFVPKRSFKAPLFMVDLGSLYSRNFRQA